MVCVLVTKGMEKLLAQALGVRVCCGLAYSARAVTPAFSRDQTLAPEARFHRECHSTPSCRHISRSRGTDMPRTLV